MVVRNRNNLDFDPIRFKAQDRVSRVRATRLRNVRGLRRVLIGWLTNAAWVDDNSTFRGRNPCDVTMAAEHNSGAYFAYPLGYLFSGCQSELTNNNIFEHISVIVIGSAVTSENAVHQIEV